MILYKFLGQKAFITNFSDDPSVDIQIRLYNRKIFWLIFFTKKIIGFNSKINLAYIVFSLVNNKSSAENMQNKSEQVNK